MSAMCETRRGTLPLPNVRRTGNQVLALVEQHARSLDSEHERFAEGSVNLEGGQARMGNDEVMDWHFTYTVYVPGCTSWGKPLS